MVALEVSTEIGTYVPFRKRIINHDIMNCTAEGVAGNYLYSGRALGISEPDDVLQLHPELKSEWPAIKAHYENIGLRTTKNVIWDVNFNMGDQYSTFEPSVFFFGKEQQTFCRNDNWYRVVQYINSKNNFATLAEELNMDIPKTFRFIGVSEIYEDDIKRFPYPCYLKAAISVSGVGIYRCEHEYELREALNNFDKRIPVQIQEEVNTDIFLNMQYRVKDYHLERLATTEQILDGYAHQGNRSPACCEPWHSVETMAEWLFSHGIKGIFAFDVAVVEEKGKKRYLPIECNPRFNGASYPTLIAEKLGVTNWLARTYNTSKRHLRYIDLTGIEYHPSLGKGVIIVNWGPIHVGKLLCMIVGTPENQQELKIELEKRL